MATRDPGQRDMGMPRAIPPGPGGASATPPTAGEELQRQASQTVGQVQETAGQLKEQVVAQATTKLDEQREQAVGGLQGVAHAFRQTSHHLREGDQGTIAGYVDQAAERLDSVTGYLRGRDIGQLVGDLERFSRREPALFLGGAFVLGLLGARFLKSSAPPAPPMPARPMGRYSPPPMPPMPRPARDAGMMGTPPVPPPLPGATGSGAPGSGSRPGMEQDVIVGGPPHDWPRTNPVRPAMPPTTGRPGPTPRGNGDAGA